MVSKKPSLEKSLSDLEKLVESMEQGQLSLEDSLERFEQGIKLARECQGTLSQAEQKVQMLIEKNGQLGLAPFDGPEDED